MHLDRLGVHSLKSFPGAYDASGNPAIRDDTRLTESLYRFKGQSTSVVVLTEIEFESLDEQTFGKLFVGMTRARLRLPLALNDSAAAAVMHRLS